LNTAASASNRLCPRANAGAMFSRQRDIPSRRRGKSLGCVLWVADLSVGVLGPMLRLLGRHGRLEVRYLRSTPAMSRLSRVFRLFGSRVSFHLVKHLNGAEPDARGTMLYCRMEHLASLWAGLLAGHVLEAWNSMGMPSWALGDRSRLYAECEAAAYIGEMAALAAHAEKDARTRDGGVAQYLGVPSYLSPPGLQEKLRLSRLRIRRLPGKAPEGLAAVLRRLGVMHDLAKSWQGLQERPSSPPRNVSVRRTEGFDLSRRSDLFWFPQSKMDPSRVIYFLTHRMPGLSGDKERMARWGIKPVPLTDELAGELGAPAWKPKPAPPRPRGFSAPLRMMARAFRRQPWGRIALAAAAGERLLSQAAYWAEFLDDHQVAADFSGGETDQAMKAKHVALDLRGGVQFARQRSLFWLMPLGAEIGLNHGHVVFLWGRDGHQIVRAAGNRLIYGVVTGFIYDYTIAEAREKAALLRQRLMERGARFAVALFDVNPATPAVTPEDYLAFYHGFLDWLEQDESLALIAKPKKEIDESLAPGLRERLESLAARTGRVVTLPVRTQPAVAALASDFAVGIGLNSAVTEAVIMGKPGIHWDRGRLVSHRYYQWGRGKVVLNDLDAMLAALEKWRANPRSQPGLGDFSPIIDELDPFRDGEAHARAGSYVRWVVDALAEGRGRDRALEEANQRYAQRWGSDKIIKFS